MQRLGIKLAAGRRLLYGLKQEDSRRLGLFGSRGFAEDSGEGSEPVEEAPQEDVKLDNRGRRRLHGGRRLRRREKGSWNNSGVIIEAGQHAPIWPANVPVYDLQTQAPFLFEEFNPVFEAYKDLREKDPERFAQLLQSQTPDLPPPREGASKILEWEVNVVFDMDPQTLEPHPLNKKVKCRVYLRDLQQEFNLSDQALQCIARICGPRYNPNKGLLTLTSERYRDREANRLHIADMLNELVKEGQKMFPSSDFKESLNLTADLQSKSRVSEEKQQIEATA